MISAEQLVAALEVQMSTLVPIGQLALEEGCSRPRDIFDVLLAQSDAPNVRFGDLAVEMGLHDARRRDAAADDPSRPQAPIAEILVGQGVLSEPQLAARAGRSIAEPQLRPTRRRLTNRASRRRRQNDRLCKLVDATAYSRPSPAMNVRSPPDACKRTPLNSAIASASR